MSSLFIRGLVSAAFLTLAPATSFAQDVFGDINASLDGEDRAWSLTIQDDESQSFVTSVAVANLQSFNLWGQPAPDVVNSLDDSLLLTFDVMSVGGQVIPLNVSLTYFEDGWKTGWLANDPEKTVFTLTTFEETDDGIMVEGTFEATASYSEALSNGEVDPTKTQQLSGHFGATLPSVLIKER